MLSRPDKIWRTLSELLDDSGRGQFWLLSSVSVLVSVSNLLTVLSVVPFLSYLSTGSAALPQVLEQHLAGQEPSSALLILGSLMLLAVSAANASQLLHHWLQARFTGFQSAALSSRLLQSYLGRHYLERLESHSSDLLRRLLSDVGVAFHQFVQPLQSLLRSGLSIALVLLGLLYLQPQVTLIAGGFFAVLYGLTFFLLRRRLKTLGAQRLLAEGDTFRAASDIFSGHAAIIQNGKQEYFLDRFREANLQRARLVVGESLLTRSPRMVIELLGFGLLLALSLWTSHQASQQLLPLLGLFGVAGVRLIPQLQSLFVSLAAIRQSGPVVEQLLEHLEQPKGAENLEPAPPWEGSLRLDSVEFHYSGKKPLFQGLSAQLQRGDSVGLFGETGAGKSTLLGLLTGRLSPTQGRVLVDDQELTALQYRAWRERIAYVPQDLFLMEGSFRENIAFGIPQAEICEETLEGVIEQCQLQELMKRLPSGVESKIGEDGVKLSGGERQRVGLARALYRKPEVLVLDEATNALDLETEARILQTILEAYPQLTLLLTAHRQETLQVCRQRWHLQEGRLTCSPTTP